MKILLLTTYYPPDTAIAAVRPYMFAKYMTKLGHSVTVLRSGEINNSCENFFDPIPEVQVISYLGENSPAEAFARGQWKKPQNQGKSRIDILPPKIRLPIAKLYHWVMQDKEHSKYLQLRNQRLEKQKEALAQLKAQGTTFDVVFSTYGEIENIFAGSYAAKLFDCKLIQDFRDSAAPSYELNRRKLKKMRAIQADAVRQADAVTAVSHGLLSELFLDANCNTRGITLYNGFEPISDTPTQIRDNPEVSNLFSLCYTGQMYTGKRDFSPVLQALNALHDQGKIDLSKVRIHYAGPDFPQLSAAASALHLDGILVDHGYVSRSEAAQLQMRSDIFVVLSWNTKTSQGILTGKFYEGIRCQKPILSIVSGEVPCSELALLNEKYHYGFCYENCREKEQFQQLCDYLEALYNEKMSTGKISYTPDPALETDFRYDTLAKKLEDLCQSILP